MRLCIADPPYPPLIGVGGYKARASRWYGEGQRSAKDRPADRHPDAALWDDPAAHRALLLRLLAEFDGWAIATSPDGLAAYGALPVACRIMAWVKPNATPPRRRIRRTRELTRKLCAMSDDQLARLLFEAAALLRATAEVDLWAPE